MNNVLYAVGGFVLGFLVSWYVFAPAAVVVEAEKPVVEAPVTPAEPEAAVPPVEVVPMPPQEIVEPTPVEEKVAE